MNVIVTGGAGFIGSALIRYLVGVRGWRVTNIDKLTYAANLNSLASVAHDPNYAFEKVDICDGAELQRIFAEVKPDAVMHLAAESHVDRSITGSAEFIRTNVNGNTYAARSGARLLERTGRRCSAKPLLHVSTDEVYGLLPPDGYFLETTSYDPRSPYSASKAVRRIDAPWSARGTRTYRFANADHQLLEQLWPVSFSGKAHSAGAAQRSKGKPLPVYGDGRQVRLAVCG